MIYTQGLFHTLSFPCDETQFSLFYDSMQMSMNALRKVTCVHTDALTSLDHTNVFAQGDSKLPPMAECAKVTIVS